MLDGSEVRISKVILEYEYQNTPEEAPDSGLTGKRLKIQKNGSNA